MKYYVISDLHGKKGIINKIDTILKEYEIDGNISKLIINGDCIDGGKEGFELLYYVKDLYYQGKVILLRGNHERFFLDWIKSNDSLWIKNDYQQYGLTWLLKNTVYKDKTIKSKYNVLTINGTPVDSMTLKHLKALILDENKELIDWLEKLPNKLVLKDYIIVHAGLDFDKQDTSAWKYTSERKMESINPLKMNQNNSGKWLVLGHFWSNKFHKSNDIYVDDEDKRIQIDGDILNGGQLNMLEITDEDDNFIIHNNI